MEISIQSLTRDPHPFIFDDDDDFLSLSESKIGIKVLYYINY